MISNKIRPSMALKNRGGMHHESTTKVPSSILVYVRFINDEVIRTTLPL